MCQESTNTHSQRNHALWCAAYPEDYVYIYGFAGCESHLFLTSGLLLNIKNL